MQSVYKTLIFLLVFCSFCANAENLDSLALEKDKGAWFVIHMVDQGETLYGLARRYQSTVAEIVAENALENQQVSLFQKIRIPVSKEYAKTGKRNVAQTDKPVQMDDIQGLESVQDSVISNVKSGDKYHVVEPKETLFSLSRKYGVSLDNLRSWNKLQSDGLDIGQKLIVSTTRNISKEEVKKEVEVIKTERATGDNFTTYLVQTGDIIETIAVKFQITPDSILYWNNLPNEYLAIGQKLKIKGEIDSLTQTLPTNIVKMPYGAIRKDIDESGFARVYEEGVALAIDTPMQSDKALALHRSRPIGAMMEVKNLMNNKKILVKVVGKLPETGLNKNVLIRLTPTSLKRLGVIDAKSRVEVTYYE